MKHVALKILLVFILFFQLISCKNSKIFGENAYNNIIDLEVPVVTIYPDAPYQPTMEKKWEMLHIDLAIEPNFSNKTISAVAKIYVKPFAYPQSILDLDAKAMEIGYVLLGADTLLFEYLNNEKIRLRFDRQKTPQDTVQIVFGYQAGVHYDKLKESVDYDKRGVFWINHLGIDSIKPQQVYTTGETNYNSYWMPCLDAPNQRFSQDFYITLDTALNSFSNGDLQYSIYNGDGTKTDYWKLEKPHATYLSVFGVGNWEVIKDTLTEKNVYYYLEPKYAKYSTLLFGKTPKMINFFEEKLKVPYVWGSFKQLVVRDFVTGAMENTTAVIHSEVLQHTPTEHYDFTGEDYIVHELAHQWFGDLVTTESWSQLSLNEGFATFSEYLWKAYAYDESVASFARRDDRAAYLGETRRVNKIKPIVQYNYNEDEELFDAHRYQKAGLTLNMLRLELGDEIFFKGITQYLKERSYKTAEFNHLRLILEEISGRDLHQWFNYHFYEKNHPKIEVIDSGKQQILVKLNHNQKTPISLSVKCLYMLEDSFFEDQLILSDTINLIAKPEQFKYLLIDPNYDTYFEIKNLDLRNYKKLEALTQKNLPSEAIVEILNHTRIDSTLFTDLTNSPQDLIYNLFEELTKHKNKEVRITSFEKFTSISTKMLKLDEMLKIASITALTDPSSQVREAALYYMIDVTKSCLEKKSNKKLAYHLKNTAKKCMSDPAANVVYSAYLGMIESLIYEAEVLDIENKELILNELIRISKSLENHPYDEIRSLVGQVYFSFKVENSSSFFHRNIRNQNQYYVNGSIAQYIIYLQAVGLNTIEADLNFLSKLSYSLVPNQKSFYSSLLSNLIEYVNTMNNKEVSDLETTLKNIQQQIKQELQGE